MQRFSLVAALTAVVWASVAGADTTVHILHINDLHSRLEPVNRFNATCDAEDDAAGKCFGGVARIATKIAELRAELDGEPVLVLDAGDQFQGSMMYTAYKGVAEAAFMEMIGFDAMAVGNHEFDDGPSKLADFIDAVSFPVLSGNLDLSNEPALIDRVTNALVLDVGDVRVGIVSALATDTVDTSSPGDGVGFIDEVAALAVDVAELQAQDVDVIVALTHVGLSDDLRIAEAVPGLDVVVGGHSHSLLSNTVSGTAGPYPIMVGDTAVVQAGAYGRFIGHLTLTFDETGVVTSATGDTIPLDAGVLPDPDVAAKVAEFAAPLEAIKAEVVGHSAAVIEGDRGVCRLQECAMGNLVADAMLAATADQGVTMAITNAGGLRASIDAGDVTMGEVLTVLPFQNSVSTFEATGEMIIAALENGVSQVEDLKGRFPQVAGLSFTWTPSADPMQGRIQEVRVATPEGFVPIDPQASYMVVTNDYMRGGGDGYDVFEKAENAYDFGPSLDEVVAEYLGGLMEPYQPYTDGRISQE